MAISVEMSVEVFLITYREIFQNEARLKDLHGSEYQKQSAQIALDRGDMEKLGLKEGERVLAENELGEVIVSARPSDSDPHPGLAFMAKSPWSNALLSDETCSPGAQSAKTKLKLSPSSQELTTVFDLLERMRT
jgi:formylmethanofuran dehydrogenase subunit D